MAGEPPSVGEPDPRSEQPPDEGVVTTGVDPEGAIKGLEMPLAENVSFEFSVDTNLDDDWWSVTLWMHAGHWELPVFTHSNTGEAGLDVFFGTSPEFETGERYPVRPTVYELICQAVQQGYQSVEDERREELEALEWFEGVTLTAFAENYAPSEGKPTSGLMRVFFDKGREYGERQIGGL